MPAHWFTETVSRMKTARNFDAGSAQSWGYSLLLLAVYLVSFHSWQSMPEGLVVVTGWIVPLILTFLGYEAWKRGSFVNHLDAGCHAGVILDLWMEGVFVRLHEGLTFYGCALAFTVLITGYRLWVIHHSRRSRSLAAA